MKPHYIKFMLILSALLPVAAVADEISSEKSIYFNIHGALGLTSTSGFESWKIEKASAYQTQIWQNPKYADSFPISYGTEKNNSNNSIWGICYEAAFFYRNFGVGLSALVNYSSFNYANNSDLEIIKPDGTLIAGISGSPDFRIISPTLYYLIELEPVSKSRRFVRLGAGVDFVNMDYKLIIRKNNNTDLPDPSPYEMTYSAQTLGWHISAGYIINYDLWTISGIFSFTRAQASDFKNGSTGAVMRYSDGSKVKTTLHNFLFCIGAGLRVSWK